MKTITRRHFIQHSLKTSALLAPLVIPAAALGRDGIVAPSERIAVGFAGVGRMNMDHLRGMLTHQDVQVVALSDPDKWRRDHHLTVVETAYAKRKESGRFKGCDLYNSFTDMLDRPEIDAFLMAIGERWHGIGVSLCARAGKHVYVEKPSSYTIAEALDAIEDVRRYGITCQVGFQQRSAENFDFVCKQVREGAIGKIKNVYMNGTGASVESDLPAEPLPPTLDWEPWIGPCEMRPFNKRLHYIGKPLNVVPWAFCKGLGLSGLGGNGTHAFDIVHWGLDCETTGPLEVIPRESKQVPYLTFKYPNDVTLQVIHGRLDPKVHEIPKGFDPIIPIKLFGVLFVGENGWMHVGRRGFIDAWPIEAVRNRPERHAGKSHVRDWLDAIRLGRRPKCDIDIGNHSTIPAILGNTAAWLGRPLKWDPVKNEFPDDDEANRLRSRALREPWSI